MSRNASKQMSSNTDISYKPSISFKRNRKKRADGVSRFRLSNKSDYSPVRFLRRLAAKVARALCLVSSRSASSKVSSSNSGRSRPFSASVDSHRSEAIEDCIEFINSSSSFQRSNSVPATAC